MRALVVLVLAFFLLGCSESVTVDTESEGLESKDCNNYMAFGGSCVVKLDLAKDKSIPRQADDVCMISNGVCVSKSEGSEITGNVIKSGGIDCTQYMVLGGECVRNPNIPRGMIPDFADDCKVDGNVCIRR